MADRPAPRLRSAVRDEVEIRSLSLDQMLTPEHPARAVWDFTQQLNLAHLYDAIKATQHRPGHPHVDPRVLFALWLYATIDGVGSAHELFARDWFVNSTLAWVHGLHPRTRSVLPHGWGRFH